MKILTFAMFLLPALFAVIIHNYLRHGELSLKRKVHYIILYILIINMVTFGVSCARGIRGFNFSKMTLSYQLKYLGFGMVQGFIAPFGVCLVFEDIITIGGIKRYGRRFIHDLKKYLPYAVRSAKSDLKSEVANSYLNWMWWLIEPVCMMLIYTLIFGVVFKASEQYFPIFIFIGITLWGFFFKEY